MEVFLTGGSGYLGKATITALIRHGHTVEALARSEDAARAVRGSGSVPVPGGLADLDVLNAAAARAEAVVHLAQADTGEADLAGPAPCRTASDPACTSTPAVPGCTATDGVADETAPWNPPPVVAWRRPVEDAVLRRAELGGRPMVIQPGLLYGRGEPTIDTYFTAPGKRAGAIPCIGDGDNHWALVHVDDIARLYVAALRAPAGSVYVGVGGVNPTAREVGAGPEPGSGPRRENGLALPGAGSP